VLQTNGCRSKIIKMSIGSLSRLTSNKKYFVLVCFLLMLCSFWHTESFKTQSHSAAVSHPIRLMNAGRSSSNYHKLFGWPADDDDEEGFFEQGLEIFKKKGGKWEKSEKKVDNRDALPYTVFDSSPPRTKIGTFKLDPLLSPGDRITYKDKSYIVKRVRNKYKFRAGKFRMFAKEAETKEMSRSFTERVLEDLLEKTPPADN